MRWDCTQIEILEGLHWLENRLCEIATIGMDSCVRWKEEIRWTASVHNRGLQHTKNLNLTQTDKYFPTQNWQEPDNFEPES